MARKVRTRAGSTKTFSVSLDVASKRALRELADREFGGNLSALVADFAEEARRRLAAGKYLRRIGVRPLTRAQADRLDQAIRREAAEDLRRHRRRRVA